LGKERSIEREREIKRGGKITDEDDDGDFD